MAITKIIRLVTASICLATLAGQIPAQIASTSSKATVPSKPNIIFILTDDQRWDSLGVMGNPIVKTPNIDKLASEGIIFQNGYVTTSICCVSRASILTGQYESRHGINGFSTNFSPEQLDQTYPSLLKKAGYKTGFVGKYGVGKKQPADTFDFWACTKKGQPDYITQDADGTEIHDTDKVSRDVGRFLDKFGKTGPFCLSVSFKAPHEQDGHPPRLITQKRFNNLYKDVTVPTPLTAAPKYWNSFPDFFRTDNNIARQRWLDLFSTPEKYQENVKKYYRLVSGVDEAVGQLSDKLKVMGIAGNTAIIYMGDNGFFLGEHGLEGKWFGYEESIRVPLFISFAGLPDKLKQSRPEQIALNIDIAPTILGIAGVQAPQDMQGVDLIAMLEGKVPERQDFFYEHTYLKSPKLPQVEGVVTHDFKYMKYIEHDYEELYDVSHDPHETRNLATDKKYAGKLDELRARYSNLKSAAK